MLTRFVQKAPFSFLIVPFIGGIMMSSQTSEVSVIVIVLALVSFFCCLLFQKNLLCVNLFLFLSLFFVGHLIVSLQNKKEALIDSFTNKLVSVDFIVLDPSYGNSKYYKSYLVKTSQLPGKYIIRDYEQKENVQVGSLLILERSELKQFSYQTLPGEFNYGDYLRQNHIYGYFTGNFTVKQPAELCICSLFARWRNRVVENFSNLSWDNRQQGFLQAITMGDKTLLDDALKQAFMRTGMSHVLAVSGLHVGILYVFLLRIFFTVKNRRNKAMLIIFFLWMYAFFVGLPVSVTRAVFMFSLMESGRVFQKDVTIYNAIFISAFFLLIINPRILYDVGFQLSYTAVLSIVFFFPRIRAYFPSGNFVVSKLFDLFSVSLSAQLGTFPFVIYYFHSFPVYFLLGNIFFVPLVMLLVVGGIILIPLSFFPGVADIFLRLIKPLIDIVFVGTQYVSFWPFAQINNIFISEGHLFFLLSGILSFVLIIKTKRLIYFGVLLCVLLYIQGNELYGNIQNKVAFHPFKKTSIEGIFVISSSQKDHHQLFFRGDSLHMKDFSSFFKRNKIDTSALNIKKLKETERLTVFRKGKEVCVYE